MQQSIKQKIALIPFVCGAGASTGGCERGPVDLEQYGLQDYLTGRGYDAVWQDSPAALYDGPMGEAAHKDLPPPGAPERKEITLFHCRYLRDQVAAAIRANKKPVTIGGDHTMAAGSLAGLAQARHAHGRIGVVWIDAHADINTPESSPSGSWHGMPLAALTGRGDADFCALAGGKQAIDPAHIVYLGLRDVDPPEQALIDDDNIFCLTMDDIHKIGIVAAFDQAMAHLAGKVDHLALSLDLDAFDPAEAQSVGTPVPDGFKSSDLLPVLRKLVTDHDFDLVEVTEYNPTLPGRDATVTLARDAIESLVPQPSS